MALLQQFDGVSALLFYAPTIMQQAGFPQASKAIFVTLVIGAWNLLCTGISIWLVDRVGRRPLLLFGSMGMAIGLAAMGIFFHLHMTGLAVPLTMMFAVAAFSMTLAPVTWLVMAEIFPNDLRGMGMAVVSPALWIADFATSFSFPVVTAFFERHFGSAAGAFWLFSRSLGIHVHLLLANGSGNERENIGGNCRLVGSQAFFLMKGGPRGPH